MGGESRDVDVRTGSEGGEQGGREGDDGDEEMKLRAVFGATVGGGDVLERRGEAGWARIHACAGRRGGV